MPEERKYRRNDIPIFGREEALLSDDELLFKKGNRFNKEYSSPIYQPMNTYSDIDKIKEATRNKNFLSPQINQPDLGTKLDVINATTKDRPIIWDSIPDDVKQRLSVSKDLSQMPRAKQIDPVTKEALKLTLAPAKSFAEGIPEGVNKMVEGLQTGAKGDKGTGFLQFLSGLTGTGFSAITPFTPVMSGFSIAGQGAEDIGAGGIFHTLMSPTQSILNPKSEGGKAAAELADLVYNALLFSKAHNLIKNRTKPELKPNEVEPTKELPQEEPEILNEPKSKDIIERRTNKAGQEYYYNTETKKRISKAEYDKFIKEKENNNATPIRSNERQVQENDVVQSGEVKSSENLQQQAPETTSNPQKQVTVKEGVKPEIKQPKELTEAETGLFLKEFGNTGYTFRDNISQYIEKLKESSARPDAFGYDRNKLEEWNRDIAELENIQKQGYTNLIDYFRDKQSKRTEASPSNLSEKLKSEDVLPKPEVKPEIKQPYEMSKDEFTKNTIVKDYGQKGTQLIYPDGTKEWVNWKEKKATSSAIDFNIEKKYNQILDEAGSKIPKDIREKENRLEPYEKSYQQFEQELLDRYGDVNKKVAKENHKLFVEKAINEGKIKSHPDYPELSKLDNNIEAKPEVKPGVKTNEQPKNIYEAPKKPIEEPANPNISILEKELPNRIPSKKDKLDISGYDGEINVKPIVKKVNAPKDKYEPFSGFLSKEDIRPALKGVYEDATNQTRVATNGHILLALEDKLIKQNKVLDPKTGLEIEHRFPNYQDVIPQKNPYTINIKIDDILDKVTGVARANKFVDGIIGSRINYGDKSILFNPEYLETILRSLKSNNINDIILELPETETRAAIIRDAKNPKNFALIMPLRQEGIPFSTVLSKTDVMLKGKSKVKPEVIKAKTNTKIEPKKNSGEQAMVGSQEIKTSMTPKSERISAVDIINEASKEFDVPIRIGKIRSKEKTGIFKVEPEVIRLQEANNLATMSHEIAHFIDKKLKPNLRDRSYNSELKNLDYDQTKKRSDEGFAEYMRHLLTGDEVPKLAPNFNKYFNDVFLKNNPEIAKKLAKIKEQITQWREQGAVSRVLSQIDFDGRDKTPIREKFQSLKLKTQTLFTNRLEPLNYAINEILKENNARLRPSENPSQIASSVAKTAPAKAREFIMNGAFDFSLNKVGKSLKEIVEPISKDYENAIAYAYAKHAESLIKRNINPGISLEDAQYVIKNNFKPEYEKFSKEFTEWSNYLIDYLVDAGGISKDAQIRIREMNPFYIPLKRSFIDASISAPKGRGYTNLPEAIKRIKGSGRKIIDPLESMIAQTEQIISIADKTRVARALADLTDKFEGIGKWIEKVPPPIEAKMTKLENLKKQIEEAGGDLSNADLDQIVTLFSQGKGYFGKDNIVSIVRNGKREYFELHPDLYDAMRGLDKVTLPIFLDYTFGKAARMVRLGATGIRAGFALITNPIRDAQTFFLQSEHTGIRPDRIAESLFREMIGTNEYAKEFKRAGGEMAQPLGLDRKSLQANVQEILANDAKSKALNIVKHPIEALRGVLSFPEAGTRLTEFTSVMEKYKPKIEKAKAEGDLVELKKLQEDAAIEASNAANEVTVNFKRAGAYSAIINQIVPFFNPAIQGISAMGRTIYRHPVKSGLKATATLTAPTLALWYLNKDEDWYKNLPEWQKYAFWNFKIGDEIIRLPKPFEWGYLFASIPEGVANSIYTKDPYYVRQALIQGGENMLPDITPALVKPAMEVYFNWDMFRERPIVNKSQEGLAPSQQFNSYTSEISKTIGSILNISPAKLDHLLNGYTGGLASDIINGLPKDFNESADIPVVGRLFTRISSVGFNGENVQRFYDALEKAESLNRTKNYSTKNNNRYEISEEDKIYLDNLKNLRKTAKKLKDLKEKEKEIQKLNYDNGIKKQIEISIQESAAKIAEESIKLLLNKNKKTIIQY